MPSSPTTFLSRFGVGFDQATRAVGDFALQIGRLAILLADGFQGVCVIHFGVVHLRMDFAEVADTAKIRPLLADKNLRSWHAKMLALSTPQHNALMVGSSNFTKAGMGLRALAKRKVGSLAELKTRERLEQSGQLFYNP